MNKSLHFILSTSLVFINLNSYKVNAQIIPDNTLNSESSIVNPINYQRNQIEGGAIRGSNLFHSFQEFNIQNGVSIYFANPTGIENILSRVTGNNPSNIFGTLGVLGEANLFLINPNGILFGPNARLDLRGSFFASTADSIRLGENGEFSATQPNNNTLLTVNPSALFINQLELGNGEQETGNSNLSGFSGERLIINQSTADGVGLQVQPGQTLGLIGGNIIIDGGILTAEKGKIELGSIGENSSVNINLNSTDFTLDYSDITNFQDIKLSNNALIDVSGEGGGSVQLQGRQISLTDSSRIVSNTWGDGTGGTLKVNGDSLILREGSLLTTATFNSGSGANLNINAQKIEAVGLSPDGTIISGIFSDVVAGSSGIGGDITINTEQLHLFDGAQLGANVFGAGEGGNITVNAKTIEANGAGLFQSNDPQQAFISQFLGGMFPSGILAIVEPGATGNGGDVNINTEQLTLQNSALVGTATIGAGNSGNLNVTANDINIIANSDSDFPFSSLITSVVSPLATGNGGDINIETQRLSVQNGAQVRAGTSGVGDSGDITIRASDIEISGTSNNGLFSSNIFSGVENIDNLLPGAIGSGNGGNISIETDRLILREGGQVSATTFGSGDGGNLNINATERIDASGVSPEGEFVSGLFNSLGSGSSGNGGDITVNTPILSLTAGGSIGGNVFGSGNAGDISVNANVIELIGSDTARSADPQQQQVIEFVRDQLPSTITTLVFSGGTGTGGDITLNTQQLTIQAGASVSTGTFGAGNSGNLNIQANNIEVSGVATTGFPRSNLSTSVTSATATGKGGDLNIEAERITLRDGGSIQAGTSGRGDSGNIIIDANDIQLTGRSGDGIFPSSIFTSVQDVSAFIPGAVGSGNAGNLTIDSDRITLTDGAEISASTFGSGDAGNLLINATEIIARDAFIREDSFSSIFGGIRVDVFPGATGNGGNLTLNTDRLTLSNGTQVSTNMFGSSQGGVLRVNASEIEAVGVSESYISIIGSIIFPGATGNAGDIIINTDRLSLRDGAAVSTAVYGTGRGGNLEVNAREIEAVGGGAVRSFDPQYTQLLQLSGGLIPSGILTTVLPDAVGIGGDLRVNTEQITIDNGAQIGSGTFGAGNSGDLVVEATGEITIRSTSNIGLFPSTIFTSVIGGDATGNGGNLRVEAGQINLQDGGQIRAGTSGMGHSGDLTVMASDIQLTGRSGNNLFPSSILTSVEDFSAFDPTVIGSGNAGNLTIDSDRMTLTEGAEITASTFGSGNAGNTSINADIIQLDNSLISVNSAANAVGTVGGITIDTETLNLTNSAIETVTLGQGNAGNIRVNANNITASGVANDPVFPTDPANNQFLAGIRSIVGTAATGDSGNINVNTQQLLLQNGGAVGSFVRGAGEGGNVTVNAENIDIRQTATFNNQDPPLLDSLSAFGGQFPSGIFTTVFSGAVGTGGNLAINTSNLSLQESGAVGAGTFGSGDSGNLTVTAGEIELTGKDNVFPFPSILFTSAFFGASGQGGDILIETDRLSLRDGGQIRAGTSGVGDSGNIAVIASEIELIGRSSDLLFPSSILTNVEDFSFLVPDAVGKGNGGNLYIESGRITLTNGGEITASTFGSGDAGNIFVNAREIEASGAILVGDFVVPSGLRVDVLPSATGNGGNLTVNTDRLTLRDGGQLSTNMFSSSETVRSGNLTVNATVIEATGVSINSPSGLITNVQNGAAGSAGTLEVNAERISLTEGAEISSLIAGTGSGGNLEVNAREIEAVGVGVGKATNPIEEQILLFLGGTFPSGILTTVLPTASGQGGNLTVNAERITIKDSAQLGTGTFGTGNSGDLRVEANEINVSGLSVSGFPPTSIQTAVLGGNASGDGGDAIIEAQRINLSEGGQIRSGTSGSGNSGNLTIIAPEIEISGTSFDGRFPSGILTEVEDFSDVPPEVIGSGNGGNLTINSNRISIEDGAAITTSSFGEGAAGSLEIDADVVQLNDGMISAETASGSEGNITLNTQAIRLNNNSLITTNAMTEATGGNINIDTEIATLAENSQISANAVQGQGGNIQLNAKVLFSDNNSQITASSTFGIDGNIELNTFSDFTQAVVTLPTEIIDINTLISQDLCKPTATDIAEGSSLVISGRGGLPPSPVEPLTPLQGLVEWQPAPQQGENVKQETQPVSITEAESKVTIRYPTQQHSAIRQAQGWVRTATGEIILTETPPTVTPQGVPLSHPDC
ncbi:MAG: filamentous hemagglutinin N-terminal domain-containing protein [Microcoleaceae cyanobacterium]